jgi:hypothetical protein
MRLERAAKKVTDPATSSAPLGALDPPAATSGR